MSFDSITNRAEFFSDHYLDSVMSADLGGLRTWWDETESSGGDTARTRLRGASKAFFDARAAATEASRAALPDSVRRLNEVVLTALGYPPARTTLDLKYNTTELVSVPVAAHVDTPTGLLLVALDAGLADDVDDLFDDAEGAPGRLLEPLWRTPTTRLAAVSPTPWATSSPATTRPATCWCAAGRVLLLAERAKWAEGASSPSTSTWRSSATTPRRPARSRPSPRCSRRCAGAPRRPVGVRGAGPTAPTSTPSGCPRSCASGIRESIEILANEVIQQRLAEPRRSTTATNRVDPTPAHDPQCLRYLYRLLVLLYAESRPELGILPVDDEAYREGYSLDRLRELCLVELDTDRARTAATSTSRSGAVRPGERGLPRRARRPADAGSTPRYTTRAARTTCSSPASTPRCSTPRRCRCSTA
jgi:hypothetical protein